MGIKAVECYGIECDFPDCGTELESWEGFTVWTNHGWADDVAIGADWRRGRGRSKGMYFCDAHSVYEEDDLDKTPLNDLPLPPFLTARSEYDDEVELVKGGFGR